MSEIQIIPMGSLGYDFVPAEFLHEGEDEYARRNEQVGASDDRWRPLQADEIVTLTRNGNTSDDWNRVLVTDPFRPRLVRNCRFFGLVRIGTMHEVYLSHHDMQLPVGLTNSTIISCDVGNDSAVHNVRYLSHVIIGDNCILLNLDEFHTSNHAKFGNGILKEGEDEDIRIWLDIGNEAGGRSVIPFVGMTPGDAYLWSRYRDDETLMERLREITQRQFDPRRGYYSMVGNDCVIKNSRILKDVVFGPCAYVKGANKLKNLTVASTEEEPTQIGEGVELVNGVISPGCHIFYGCKAVRFIMGPCSNLKYGARLIHSFLGDNSTVSCCEILNNLIFPAHEQHHNNSFLIASTVLGQSNIAAGATIGSNHNSRANDGEILAGRGFWPGLCTSLKHSCRFAGFTLIAKGDYPAELNIPLPFSLLSNDEAHDRLLVIPAYWWLYNMYALMRNSWKFRHRDHRQVKTQNIEFDFLAPDTVEEILSARLLLAAWTAKARCRRDGIDPPADENSLILEGAALLDGAPDGLRDLAVIGEGMENSRREELILKPQAGWAAYRQMLLFYAATNLMDWLDANESADLGTMADTLAGRRVSGWVNLGGQLMPESDCDELRRRIREGELDNWPAIHAAEEDLWLRYPQQKQAHAYAVLSELLGCERIEADAWAALLAEAVEIQQYVCDQTFRTREKDFENPFRHTTSRCEAERQAVFGCAEENPFVRQVREQTESFRRRAEKLARRK
jgi:hypothetical protein